MRWPARWTMCSPSVGAARRSLDLSRRRLVSDQVVDDAVKALHDEHPAADHYFDHYRFAVIVLD